MRAAVIKTLSGPGGVEVREVAEPHASSNEVLIDVAYAGISFPSRFRAVNDSKNTFPIRFLNGKFGFRT